MNNLKFMTLRAANLARLPLYKNKHGLIPSHGPDGSGWALSTWCNAVTGELGEAANIIKKMERGDYETPEAMKAATQTLAHEFADIVTYLDILAFRAGIDLGQAVYDKFNIVSERVNVPVFLQRVPYTTKIILHKNIL